MSIKKDNVNVTAVKYNSQDVNKVILDNKCVWCKPFTYTQGTLPTGVASLTCTRSSTDEPTASTGTIANGGTIYYDDKLYWTATASTGYRITAIKGSNSPVTVSGAITGTTASGLTSARISGTISQGTLPTGVASITCYRKAYNENSFSKYTGSTIYYGDQFYWTATAATEYNNPSLTYNNSSKVYTWTGSQNGSIDSVSASGLSAGTRRSFTISFGTTANKTLYGSWSSSSQTAYYGDKITVSGTTVTCYKWETTSTARWAVTVSASSNTAEYTYSAVTIAESNIASVTAEAAFTAYNTRTLNSYTITWKYLSAYPDTWTTATQTYNYGDTPSKTVSNVTSGSARKVPTGWDNLAAVTGNRTITANYKTQVNATFSGTRCSAKINGATPSNGWTDINKTITWTANTNCAFSSDGSTTTTNDTISTQKTNYTASADYVNVTKLTGTNCSTNFTTGWKPITDKITWTARTAYSFDDTSNITSKSVAVVPGENTYTASYVKRFTLTISAINGSYGTYSVTRTSSPYQGAGTGALSDGATIYYGDVLTGTSSAKAVSYDGWSVTSVTAPTATTTGDATSGNLTITNKSSHSAILYYNTSNAVGGTSAGTAAANRSATVTGLEFNKQYYISARVDRTRTKHTYATDGDQYSGTNGVTRSVVATFKFKDTTSTETGTIYSSVVSAKTAAQNKYTVTFSTTSGQYGSWGTASISNVPYGTTITRSGNTVTVGSVGSSTFTPVSTTVQYTYETPTFNVPRSVTGATTVTGGCTRSNRVYTIKWIGADGSTVLETDSNVAYNAVLTYNGSTPSKPSTAQYSYAFSAWKLGSTSGSTVTSGSTTNSGSTSSTTIKIYATFTETLNSYTVTFSTRSGEYGSWSTASIPNVPYGTPITPNGYTMTVGDFGSSTFTSPSTTVQYNYTNTSFKYSSSVTGATTIEGGCKRSDRLYTVYWNGAGGETLEKDSNVKYGDVLIYNGSTPSKPSTEQYSYAFSAWKLGSTSGSTVTPGTTTNAGSTSSTMIDIYATFTSTTRSYTVTFSTFSGQYGSWSTASIPNVPYGTPITKDGYTVTIGSIGSSTFTPAQTTAQYNYEAPNFKVPSSASGAGTVRGATTIEAGCKRSDRLYTIQWIGENGRTVLETDSDVKYGDVLIYNGSTPSKTSTDQYSYAFSAWKLGSTSGSTVTSGTTTNAGSTSSTTIKIYSTFTETLNSYTITWKYMSDYDSWTTATQSYNYGATPSRETPSSNIYNGDKRYVPLKWDDLSKVTGNRTITCTYKHQIYYRYNEINCGYFSGTTAGWYDGTSLSYSTTFTSNSGYAFDDRGNTTKTYSGTTNGNHSDTVVAQPSYIKITASSSNTSCFLSTSSVGIPGKTYIWVTSGSTVYAYAKLKSFVSSVPSTWSLQSGTALCPDAIYSVSSDTYYSPTTINYSATITTGRFWCAHKERQETSFSAVAYSTSQNFNGARWTDSYYSVNNSLNVYATCAFARSKPVSQSSTLWPYSTSFNINGPITAAFRAEYTEFRTGLAYKTPEYILYKVSPDGTMTNSVMDANKTKDLTADYLWVLTIERPAGKSDDTATTT